MSATLSRDQYLARADACRWELAQAQRRALEESHRHDQQREALAAEHRRACVDLGAALLPGLDAGSIARAVQLTGYAPLAQRDLPGEVARTRAELAARIAVVDADPRYAQRELLRHPTTGTLTVRRAEAASMRAPLEDVLTRAEHLRLERLLEVGYGTEDYAVPFWRLAYYSDWEAGDEILAAFPGKTFAQVRAEVLEAREAVAVYDRVLAELDEELRAGVAMEAYRDQLYASWAQAEPRVLEGARTQLVEIVLGLGAELMGPRLRPSADVHLAYLRATGTATKLEYLDRMVRSLIDHVALEIAPQLERLDRDIAKWSRPKKAGQRFPVELVDQRFRSRKERYDKQLERHAKAYVAVRRFDEWERARDADDFVWWYVMTSGRWHADYLPDVQRWDATHPGWSPPHYVSSEHERAADDWAVEHAGHAGSAPDAQGGDAWLDAS